MSQSIMVEQSPEREGLRLKIQPSDSDGVLDFVDENEEWAKIERVMASLDTGLCNDAEDEHIHDILDGKELFLTGSSGSLSRDQQQTGQQSINEASVLPVFPAYDRELSGWLSSLKLSKYEHLLIANGFDDLRFLGPEIMNEEDLVGIGMQDETDREKLLLHAAQTHLSHSNGHHNSISSPPKSRSSLSSFKSVKDWLASLNLTDYYETFRIHGCSDIEHLLNIWDLQLTSVFHISRLGHLNRMMASINSFRSKKQKQIQQIQVTESKNNITHKTNGYYDSTTPKHSSDDSDATHDVSYNLNDFLARRLDFNNHGYATTTTAGPEKLHSSLHGDVSLYKDYSSLKSNKSGKSSASSTLKRRGGGGENGGDVTGVNSRQDVITLEEVLMNCGVSDLPILSSSPSSPPASTLSSKYPSAQVPLKSSSYGPGAVDTTTAIKTPPTSTTTTNPAASKPGLQQSQLKAQSNYCVLYLGSVRLPSIDRPDLARKCIEQIRLSSADSRKVVITVSHKLVIFKDQMSQEVLGAHDISNIFCVCQDSEHLEYFAFVTWDAVESVHFCHVFNAQYLRLSTDIVLALGKAFEVAFQLIQQQNLPISPPSNISRSISKEVSTFV